MKTFAWRRVLPLVGDVWVQLNPLNGKYRWRCPGRVEFMDWSYSQFATHDDAFGAAEKAIQRAPSLVRP